MQRVYNFSAGPSMLPLPVLERAQKDLVNYGGTGCSVMEMSHRSKPFIAITDNAEAKLRKLMHIPDDYAVLFLQGGASTQFSAIPMNLAKQGDTMDYAVTGNFANKAMQEGARWGNAKVVASSKADGYRYIPKITADMLDKDAAFLHITGNNTIFGSCYNALPEHGDVPLVADWSSAILGKEIDVAAHDLIYAGAQKNMGIAGLTVVMLRKELLEREADPIVPTMLRYKIAADNGSMYNTPPCFAIYMAGLVFDYLDEIGGLAVAEAENRRKAALLYDALDASALFETRVAKEDRSITNVTFFLPTEEETAAFLAMAEGRSMTNLKGHRVAGGCRASLYNGMPYEGVETLVECIRDFENGLTK